MVASHHGNNIGLRELRRRHALSLKGSTLAQVIEIEARSAFVAAHYAWTWST